MNLAKITFGNGFFTLSKSEFNRVKIMILDYNKDGLEDRVGEIKAKMNAGMTYEEAEKSVSISILYRWLLKL